MNTNNKRGGQGSSGGESIKGLIQEAVLKGISKPFIPAGVLGAGTTLGPLQAPVLVQVMVFAPGVLGPVQAPGPFQDLPQMPAPSPELQLHLMSMVPAAVEQQLQVDTCQHLEVPLTLPCSCPCTGLLRIHSR